MRAAGTMCALLAMACSMTGCTGMTSPTRVPVPPPAPPGGAPVLAVFTDRATGFSTSDVRDADEQIVRFNAAGELIWIDDGTRFAGYIADGQVITADRICQACYFFVRFGSRNGEPRAYLTWAGDDTDAQPATLLDVDVSAGRLVVKSTTTPVPRT